MSDGKIGFIGLGNMGGPIAANIARGGHDLIVFDAIEQALQVAESGHGLAMGRRPVVDDWLARGRLVAPFGTADPTGAAYYLCRTADVAPTAAGRRVEHWLMETAEEWINTNASLE